MFDSLFLAHPRAVGEGYRDHAAAAGRIGAAMIVGGLACLVHAGVPGLFVTTGSATLRRLHARVVLRRPGHATPTHAPLFYEI